MATSPTTKNASFALLHTTGPQTLGTDHTQFAISFKTGSTPSTPANTEDLSLGAGAEGNDAIFHPRNTALEFAWRLSTRFTGVANDVGRTCGLGIFIFRDNQDGGGEGTSRVVYIDVSAEASRAYSTGALASQATGTGTIPASHFVQPGTYKIVPVIYKINGQTESDTTPPRASIANEPNVDECYVDADNNANSSTGIGSSPVATAMSVGRVAWIRVAADAQTMAVSGDTTLGITDQRTTTFDLTSATLNNPKQVRYMLNPPADATTVVGVKSTSLTPDADGTEPTTPSTFTVDGLFPTAATNHRLRILTGPRGGQSSTPSGEIPDLLAAGTLVIPNTNDKAWLVFETPAAGITKKDDYCVEWDTTLSIGSDLVAWKNSAGTQAGVGCFSSSAYTTIQRLFNRTYEASTQNAVPFLEVYLKNVHGEAIASKTFTVAVRTGEGSAVDENSQSLATDANGRIRWNYTIANNHRAFNRYKTAINTVDSEATAPLTIPASDVPGSHPFSDDVFVGPYPAYPKDVRFTTTMGANEVMDETADVFGTHSEGWAGVKGSRTSPAGGTYTSDAGQAIDNVNGVPTGVGRRTKGLATGSARVKPWTSEYDEGNNVIEFPTRYALRDVAGRQILTTVSADYWFGRWGAWNETFATVEIAAADMSDTGSNDTRLQGSLGYSPAFLTLSVADDPSVISILIGFADISATRASFGFTNGNTYGFSSDVGNYGAIKQTFQWIAVDPDLNIFVTLTNNQLSPGDLLHVHAQMVRLLPDNSHAEISPDNPLHIKIFKHHSATQTNVVIVDEPMTDHGDGINYFKDYTFAADGSENATYSVMVTGFKDGSRPPDAGDANFIVGVQDSDKTLIVKIRNDTDIDNHLLAGDAITVIAQGFSDDGSVFDLDTSPVPEVSIFRHGSTANEYWDESAAAWKNAVTQGPVIFYPMTLDAANKRWLRSFTNTSSWTRDIIAHTNAFHGAVHYQGIHEREIVGDKFKHSAVNEASIPFDSVPISLGGTGHDHRGPTASGGDGSSPIHRRTMR